MMQSLRRFTQILPILTLSMALAVAVWISAITEADPNTVDNYPRSVSVDLVGQDPALVIVDGAAQQVTVRINAPQSVWRRLRNEEGLVTAVADLSGLEAGTHNVPIQITSRAVPSDIVDYSPRNLTVVLEKLLTRTLPIRLVRRGEPAIGFQVEEPELASLTVTVSGPESLVSQVNEVLATLELNNAHENISVGLPLQALNADEEPVEGITLSPERVHVEQQITQRGGYRSDLVIKPIYQGSLAPGYRLTNISVFPPAVTVYSSNPQLVNNLPGFIETMPINLAGATDDLEIPVTLNLPTGVTLVGEPTVLVQVGVAAIESSLTLTDLPVEVVGLDARLAAVVSPELVDVILSGPLPTLDALVRRDVRVQVDATGLEPGTYQLPATVEVGSAEIGVESILPATIEVVIEVAATPTPTVAVTPATPTRTPTATPR